MSESTMSISTALVLGSGGATGIAWELGVLLGLADGGLDLAADKVIGTSAGAVVAARLTTGADLSTLAVRLGGELASFASTPLRALPALVAAQLYPSRRHALLWLGRAAARAWTPDAEAVWVDRLVPDLAGVPWPRSLVIVATDATTGRPAFFTRTQPVALPAAVAASCAVPGMFPPVQIEGRPHFDGGLRSPANLDLAAGADSVIALVPQGGAVTVHRRARVQADRLAQCGSAVRFVQPDSASRVAMGPDPLAGGRTSAVLLAGRQQGRRIAAELNGFWPV
jgi:NTE family protein